MQSFNAAFLIIGNEILSGRTLEKNLPVLAKLLGARGWRLCEARVVADETDAIVGALNALRRQYAAVFTSGGIGPTHDDITTDAVAQAFGVAAAEHAEAVRILEEFYRQRGLEFTAARRRMARAPQGASILQSAFPGAPAYCMENVTVCAGVPAIFALMAAAATDALPLGVRRQSAALCVHAGESVFAAELAALAAAQPAVEIGSYPREENGAYVCQVVFTAADAARCCEAKRLFCDYLNRCRLPYEEE